MQVVASVAFMDAAPAEAASCRDTGDRPVCVAKAQLDKQAFLGSDGTLSVSLRIECDPGWVSSDVTVRVVQGDAEADGLTTTNVACDGHLHRIHLSLAPGAGSFHAGKASMSAQFLVTNAETGDSAAGHDQTTGLIKLA